MRRPSSVLFVCFALVLLLAVSWACAAPAAQPTAAPPKAAAPAASPAAAQPAPAAQGTRRIAVGTGSQGGTYYILGAGLAKHIGKYVPGVQASSQGTAGGSENIKLISAKSIEIGFADTVALRDADLAIGAYKSGRPVGFDDLRGIMIGYINVMHFIVLADSPVKTIPELKGKRIGLGQAGSQMAAISESMLKVHGLEKDRDYTPALLSFAQQSDAVKDGNLDAAINGAGLPMAAVTELATVRSVRILPWDDEAVKRLMKESPAWVADKIPAGTYKGQDKEVPTVGMPTVLFTHKDVPEDIIYGATKAIVEQNDDLAAVHPSAKEFNLQNALRVTPLKLHPGAEKYYKEKGILK